MPHLSDSQIDALRRKALSPVELLALDDHLAGCVECRKRLLVPEQIGARVAGLQEILQNAAQETDHLTYQQLEGYVTGGMDEVETEVVESHLALCESCREGAADLRGFKAALDLAPEVRPEDERHMTPAGLSAFLRGPFSWLPIPVMGAAVVAALVLWVYTSSLRKEIGTLRSQVSRLEQADAALRGEQETSRKTIASLQSRVKQPGGSDSSASPSQSGSVAAIRDGGSSVMLDTQGRLLGLEQLASPVRDAVQIALQTQRAETPGLLRELIGRPGTLMGSPGTGGPRFDLANPVGTVVLTDRPKFSWTPLAGASSYVVSIYDAGFKLVATSRPVTSTSWVPEEPLPRDTPLSWQVRAVKDGEETLAPAPPSPEARFTILKAGEEEQLRAATRAASGSHLARGVLYARAGALDEAAEEFRALLDANPQSLTARRLLDNLLKLRHP